MTAGNDDQRISLMSETQRGDGTRVHIGPGRYDSKTVSQRVEGAPDRSFWAGIKINDRDKFQVTTYRRSGCGYL